MKVILSPNEVGRKPISFTIQSGKRVIIGRSPECTIPIEDPKLSRQHSAFVLEEGVLFLEDLKSTNGTFVNGVMVTRAPVKHGDQIGFGSFVYSLELQITESASQAKRRASSTAALEPEVRLKFDLHRSPLFTPGQATETPTLSAQRASRDLATIYRIGNLLNAEHDLERLLNLILGVILDAVPADRAYLLISDDGKRLVQRASRTKGQIPELPGHGYSSTIAYDSFLKGDSIKTFDAQADSRFKDKQSVVDAKIRSVICVPIRTTEKVIGVIYLDTLAHAQPLTREDLELVSAIGLQAGAAIQRAQLTEELRLRFFDTVSALVAAVEAKDAYTKGHSDRVAAIAVKLARHMGLPVETVRTLQLAGLLHDIGKIGVAEHVLNKPGKLTPEEWKIIHNHPDEGAKIVKKVRNLEEVVRIIRHHHEDWAGSGYPAGLRGEEIPLSARIISVADGFDAMTSPRSYRPAMSERQAIEEILRATGQRYDPQIVEAFVDLHSKGGLDLKALYLFQSLKIEEM